jgi:hypothetical protein
MARRQGKLRGLGARAVLFPLRRVLVQKIAVNAALQHYFC